MYSLKISFNEGRAFEFYQIVEEAKKHYAEVRGRNAQSQEEALRESSLSTSTIRARLTQCYSSALYRSEQSELAHAHSLAGISSANHNHGHEFETPDYAGEAGVPGQSTLQNGAVRNAVTAQDSPPLYEDVST